MNSYVILLRGINVGGKNKIPMAELKACLESHSFTNVRTYIQSGNVLLDSELPALALAAKIEKLLVDSFTLDSALVKTLAIEATSYERIIRQAPEDFGADLKNYRYDVIFLLGVTSEAAILQIQTRPVIDTVWAGENVLYFRRPSLTSPDATKSYLGKLTQQPLYQSVTIRSWNTSSKLLELLKVRKRS